ncbi:hypothetical protein EBM89_18430 [Cellulomonas triticagri]|uniref:Uncharacterized protein n=1 Tax=Cellulomonas triticagri TaxID=2483352 RepID=A0A3M2IXQ9_9CELL|nr:hypothetical protein EBM89_18430 [Cellulomonas triticagri]
MVADEVGASGPPTSSRSPDLASGALACVGGIGSVPAGAGGLVRADVSTVTVAFWLVRAGAGRRSQDIP